MKRYIIKVTREVTKNHELYEKYKGITEVEYHGKTRIMHDEMPYEKLLLSYNMGDDGWEN